MKYYCYMKTKRGPTSWIASIEPIKRSNTICEANIESRGSSFHLIALSLKSGHYLCIPDWQFCCEINTYKDINTNIDLICNKLYITDAVSIAYGLANLTECFKKNHLT